MNKVSNINAGGVIASPSLFTLLDVRSPEEFDNFHIDGSLLIPLDELESRYSEIPSGKPVVVLCRSGSRSFNACYFLSDRGFDTRNLDGGLLSWNDTLLGKGLISELEFKDNKKKINFFE